MHAASAVTMLLVLVGVGAAGASRHSFTLDCSPEGSQVTFVGGFNDGKFVVVINGTVQQSEAHVVCRPGWHTYSWPCASGIENVLRWWDAVHHRQVVNAITVQCTDAAHREETITFERPQDVTPDFAGKFVW
jgi:hypothetical protein